jgi:hypothetical protein
MIYITISDELRHRICSVLDSEKEEFKEEFLKIFELNLDEEHKDYRNYFGIARDNHNMISFLDKKKIETLNYSDCWNPDKRIMSTAGKVIKKLIPLIPDKMLERFVQLYTFQNKQCYECIDTSIVCIVKGDDIKKYYLEDNYSNYGKQSDGNNSDIFASCMRYESCQDYLDIYSLNEKQVSLAVILTDSERVKSRCILWHPDSETTYYDRIYAVNNEINMSMQNCLEKLGYINISNKNIIKPFISRDITIKLQYGQHDLDYYPYADTLCCLDGHYISNRGEENLQETDGSLVNNEEDSYYCDCCDSNHDSDDDFNRITRGRRQEEYVCERCWVTDYNGDIILRNDSEDTYHDGICHENDVICLYNGIHCHCDNAIELYDGDYAYQDDSNLLKSEYHDVYFIRGDDNFIYVEEEDDWIKEKELEYDEETSTYKLLEHV